MSLDRKKIIVDAFNEFNGSNLDRLDSFYSQQVIFCDPVHKVNGLDALKEYYKGVYTNVESIRFDFKRFIEDGKFVSGEWIMTLKVKGLNSGKPFEVFGSSFFEFNDKNLVDFHRDYLDLGEMVYEKIPGVGLVIKAIKSRL